MTEHETEDANTNDSAEQANHAQSEPPRLCPPFSYRTFDSQLLLDGLIGWGVFALFMIVIIISSLLTGPAASIGYLFLAIGVSIWMVVSLGGARIAQQLPHIARLTEINLEQAESRIAQCLRRRSLPRSVRLMLYAYLGIVRHRQERFPESAAICMAVLARIGDGTFRRLGTGPTSGHIRCQLLLLLTEAQLSLGDLIGAHQSILRLYGAKRTLVQDLQFTALQTQYEIAAGYFDRAIAGFERKISMAEIMPAPQCGAMHAMLAHAAWRIGETGRADWLDKRAELICTPKQLKDFQTRLGLIPATGEIPHHSPASG